MNGVVKINFVNVIYVEIVYSLNKLIFKINDIFKRKIWELEFIFGKIEIF